MMINDDFILMLPTINGLMDNIYQKWKYLIKFDGVLFIMTPRFKYFT